jgi:2-phosphoglycerate kinase
MAAHTLAGFSIRFEWALDDLRALVSGRPIIAEGWGLRPELVAPLIDSPRRMVVMVPTQEFRHHQIRALPRAAALTHRVSDPARVQQNRLDRDRLIADDAARTARRLGIRVIEVDGTHDAGTVADIVADHFSPYLPPPKHRMD